MNKPMTDQAAPEAVVIYTDGSCAPNPGPGGWAAILRYGEHEKVLTGSDPDTTNNRMELQAALSALQALKRPCPVILHTDSEYLRQGITEWLPRWQERGWVTSDRRPVQNKDLWQDLATEVTQHEVEWRWVRGHAGDPLNERVDRLARAAIPRPEADDETGSPVVDDPKAVHLFTRASCLGAPGPGGWGVVTRREEQVTSRSGSVAQATANEMELRAALQGLQALSEPERVHLYTVSQYLQLGITRWVAGWRARGWRTKKEGRPVRHKALWLALEQAAAPHQVEWHLLSGVDRPTESEQAAELAAQAARAAQEKEENKD